jgi:hypothetical protein
VSKIERQHLQRRAYVYVRQSTMAQVERNAESRERQYELVERAVALGWTAAEVVVVDEDQGRSAKTADGRDGFQRLVADVGLGRVGIVLGIEVSRLARRNADWYGLLDLCALTDTLIADADGVYHPGLHNDRLVLGLKGTMSEAELHVLALGCAAAACTRPPRASCGCRCRRALTTTTPGGSGAPRTRRSPTRSRPCSRTSTSSRAPGR